MYDSDLQPEFPGSRSVLVVDDAGVVRRISFRFLTEAGYRVFEASSAVEALEVLEMARGQIDVVVVDVIMPEVNGVDLVRLLRERWADPSVVFMSAYPAEVLAREGLRDLNVRFLAKPFTRHELLKAVAEAIRSKQAREGQHREGEEHHAGRPRGRP